MKSRLTKSYLNGGEIRCTIMKCKLPNKISKENEWNQKNITLTGSISNLLKSEN